MKKNSFQRRHIAIQEQDLVEMLAAVKAVSLDKLIEETLPPNIERKNPLQLPTAMTEFEYASHIKDVMVKNKKFKSYLGQGYYDSITPAVIQRNIFENPGWYTQYTPYQAEISQGRLEALLNFQTMISDLTGFEIANASLLDEGTAAAEAVTMLYRNRSKKKKDENATTVLVAPSVFIQSRAIIQSRSVPMNIKVRVAEPGKENLKDCFAVILQLPTEDGLVYDPQSIVTLCQEQEIKVAIGCDIMSLVLLKEPISYGCDIAFGNSQRFGIPMGYGGPHAAYLACLAEYKRDLPGRIIGVSIDSQKRKAYRMALQTREQHIRREKATSNICTAQALLAIMAAMYASYHGKDGLIEIAETIHSQTCLLESWLSEIGFIQKNTSYFDTLRLVATKEEAIVIKDIAEAAQINLRYFSNGDIGISIDETTSLEDLQNLAKVFSTAKKTTIKFAAVDAVTKIITRMKRQSDFLSHEVFNNYHSETEMMRYLKQLENKDLSLTLSMIPLGSCTMKLNAVSEMAPVSLQEVASLHPFVPKEQAPGYQQIFQELESYLAEITELSATSLQPNSGAQGEYAGLMVIRKYFQEKEETTRNVVLIPGSAHGTNPASAIMAGMKVVVVKCDDKGNVSLGDLKEKSSKHQDELAALMITYPSTHGVFESNIKEICTIIHDSGGQVYMDGANLNAQVGLTSPGSIGADVCHINLHKTFSIPHGGGGPGMGPICVAAHLAEFLPGHSVMPTGGSKAIEAIAAAPWGSASILLISYGYIRMLGPDGLRAASQYAILNANYIKSRLESDYSIVFQGDAGRVAHELIMDFRSFKKTSGIEVEDIAKRLIDYGFHAPTMSWPVVGTMMIEPTESEPKAELDRFCEALLSIHKEIDEIAAKAQTNEQIKTDNVLKRAPHTAEMLLAQEWPYSYTREQAAYPVDSLKQLKFWPPVARIDNTYGDRNLVCTCPPLSEY